MGSICTCRPGSPYGCVGCLVPVLVLCGKIRRVWSVLGSLAFSPFLPSPFLPFLSYLQHPLEDFVATKSLKGIFALESSSAEYLCYTFLSNKNITQALAYRKKDGRFIGFMSSLFFCSGFSKMPSIFSWGLNFQHRIAGIAHNLFKFCNSSNCKQRNSRTHLQRSLIR